MKERKDDLFIDEVVSFYQREGRHDLPWRKKRTPYRILVSEIMLQQTQVGRVLYKFNEWMQKFPQLKDLREASFVNVLHLWQGLGYQRRARALHAIAKTQTTLPRTFEGLQNLPGIGVYTASAIMAFAYNKYSHPVLETNIRTALIFYYYEDTHEKIKDTTLYDILFRIEKKAQEKKVEARDLYYALMDYGAWLKSQGVSYNEKSAHYHKQTKYKGSLRELRAKALFAIAHSKPLPCDERLEEVLQQLTAEDFIVKEKNHFVIKNR